MGRPSKLSPEQWADIERRAAEGESSRSLAREFGVDESTVRARITPHTPRVREVAAKVVEARKALDTLPAHQQYVAINLADRWRSITESVAAVAELNAKTAHRFSSLANTEATKIDDADLYSDKSVATIKGVAVLQKMSNDACIVPLSLLAANKKKEDDPEGHSAMAPQIVIVKPAERIA